MASVRPTAVQPGRSIGCDPLRLTSFGRKNINQRLVLGMLCMIAETHILAVKGQDVIVV